jgi:hydroxymethylpyrimidine/phosphomethylpyrimidine kinase
MIGSPAIAEAVADRLEQADARVPLVFDPVMVATSGATLADGATIAAFERLMRLATLVTPNIPELAVLSTAGPEALAARTGTAVLAKGGHSEGALLIDALILPEGERTEWGNQRIVTRHTHGTGCTMASAIAARLARGDDLATAVARARRYVRAAIEAAPGLGQGSGPLGPGVVD